MIDGILNVYKPAGYTSFDVVAKLRGILKQKKIGHTGTLDPMAEGVLPVCLGKATKLVDMLTEGDKCYHAVMKLGIETDTEDITGAVTRRAKKEALDSVTREAAETAILSYVGAYGQIPPMYSAIRKNGKRLYEYAREGIELERQARPVKIYDIQNIAYEEEQQYSFDVLCSKGTYIRSLCRDIGRTLSCYATLTALTRLCVHGFSVKDALRPEEIERLWEEGTLADHILPVDAVLKEYPAFEIGERGRKYLHNGNPLSPRCFRTAPDSCEKRIRVYEDGIFLALYDYVEGADIYKPFKMFLS